MGAASPAIGQWPRASGQADADPFLDTLYELVFADPARPVCGALVGQYAGTGAPALCAAIPLPAGNGTAEALLSHQGWAHVHQAMSSHYPQLDVVGFYASHPGGGGGLTDAEAAVFHAHFARGYELGLIFDPQAHHGAVYGWRHGELTLEREGPIAHRELSNRPAGVPWRGLGALMVAGVLTGLAGWLAAGQPGAGVVLAG